MESNTPISESAESGNRTAEAIVFSVVALLGAGLVALLSLTNVYWLYPTIAFATIAYFAWERFLS